MASEIAVKQPKLLYGDAIRVLASISVVVIHVAAVGVVKFDLINQRDWWVFNWVDSACRWAVPVFIMLSGALLLNPNIVEPGRIFYQKRFTRVGYPLLFWSAFYLLWANNGLPASQIVKNAITAMAKGTPYFHLYFMFVLLGLYLFVPIFRVVAKYVNESQLRNFAILAVFLSSGDALLRAHTYTELNTFSYFVPYVGYFFLGFALRDVALDSIPERGCWLALLTSIVITALGSAITVHRWGNYGLGFFFTTILALR